jgi:hypothetical protein
MMDLRVRQTSTVRLTDPIEHRREELQQDTLPGRYKWVTGTKPGPTAFPQILDRRAHWQAAIAGGGIVNLWKDNIANRQRASFHHFPPLDNLQFPINELDPIRFWPIPECEFI